MPTVEHRRVGRRVARRPSLSVQFSSAQRRRQVSFILRRRVQRARHSLSQCRERRPPAGGHTRLLVCAALLLLSLYPVWLLSARRRCPRHRDQEHPRRPAVLPATRIRANLLRGWVSGRQQASTDGQRESAPRGGAPAEAGRLPGSAPAEAARPPPAARCRCSARRRRGGAASGHRRSRSERTAAGPRCTKGRSQPPPCSTAQSGRKEARLRRQSAIGRQRLEAKSLAVQRLLGRGSCCVFFARGSVALVLLPVLAQACGGAPLRLGLALGGHRSADVESARASAHLGARWRL